MTDHHQESVDLEIGLKQVDVQAFPGFEKGFFFIGKGIVLFAGLVADVEAAVEIAVSRVSDQLVRQVIISQLHEEMKTNVASYGRFGVHWDWQPS